MSRRLRPALTLLTAGLAAPAWAAQTPDVFEMDLEALSRETVTTTSRRAEALERAPGAIAVVDAEQIRRYGARDLADAIELATGTLVLGTYMFPVNVVALRGDLPGQYNTHVLLLINGRPAWEGQNSGTEMALLRAFPLAAVARVEILRGPGSVLYGTSAFAGVINVITRADIPDEASLLLADERGRGTGLQGSSHLGDFTASATLNAYRDAGFRYRANDEAGVPLRREYDETDFGFFGRLRSEHWDFQFTATRSLMGDVGTLPLSSAFPEDEDLETERQLADLAYRHPLAGGELKVHLTYNAMRTRYINPGVQPGIMSAWDYMLETTWQGALSETWDVLAGAQVQRLTGDSAGARFSAGQRFVSVPDYRETWRRAFLELRWRPTEDWLVHAGLQADQPENLSTNLSKRLAVHYGFAPSWSAGLHHAEAFRSPSLLEKTIALRGIVVGNPDLEPEKNRTDEAVLRYQGERWRAAFSLFRTQTEALIDRVPDPLLGATYVNQSAIRYRGGELELAYAGKTYAVDASWSRQHNTRGGVDNATAVPENLIKLGLRTRSPGPWQAGVHATLARDWGRLPGSLPRNPDSGNLTLVRASLTYAPHPAWELELAGENLLDEDIHVPEFSRARMNTLPHYEQGRSLWLRLAYRFDR